ncbi:MAG: anti-sigma factor [Elusimicrobiales bacterium]|nr:anti-sigma factor [Elusimicrobiales bacterium]
MEHKLCRENLSAYFDGELPPQERAAVDAHLAGCPECSAVLAQLGAVSGLVKKHGLEPVPLSLKGQVLAGPKKASYPWLKPVLALSTAAAGVLIVLNITKVPEQPSLSLGFGARASEGFGSAMSAASGETSQALPPREPAAAAVPDAGYAADGGQAEAAPAARVSANAAKYSATAAVRGSYAQAKFAARSPGAGGGGAGLSSLSGDGQPADNEAPPLDAAQKRCFCVKLSKPGVMPPYFIGRMDSQECKGRKADFLQGRTVYDLGLLNCDDLAACLEAPQEEKAAREAALKKVNDVTLELQACCRGSMENCGKACVTEFEPLLGKARADSAALEQQALRRQDACIAGAAPVKPPAGASD